jgi:hypothetical protein
MYTTTTTTSQPSFLSTRGGRLTLALVCLASIRRYRAGAEAVRAR